MQELGSMFMQQHILKELSVKLWNPYPYNESLFQLPNSLIVYEQYFNKITHIMNQ